jgi:hypothetical protein
MAPQYPRDSMISTMYGQVPSSFLAEPITLSAWLSAARTLPPPPTRGMCGDLPYFQTDETDSAESQAWMHLRITALWIIIWLLCGFIAKTFIYSRLPRSTKAHENHPFYVGQKLNQTLKVLVISGLANVAMYDMWSIPVWQQYCCLGAADVAGVLFTTSEIADLLLSGAYGFLQKVDVGHHVVHIVLGVLIRGNSGPSFIAAILMAQETSGIFLNYFLLMRNRAPSHWSVPVSFLGFAICFLVWRLGFGTYGTLHYLTHARDSLGPHYPPLHARIIGGCLVAASLLQWYWGVEIVRSVVSKFSNKGGAATKKAQ